MLSVSRVNVFRIVVALAFLVVVLTPYMGLGVNLTFACTGHGTQCGGG